MFSTKFDIAVDQKHVLHSVCAQLSFARVINFAARANAHTCNGHSNLKRTKR
jgi:hypothetical protein